MEADSACVFYFDRQKTVWGTLELIFELSNYEQSQKE